MKIEKVAGHQLLVKIPEHISNIFNDQKKYDSSANNW